jgi:PAS domain S-box-containing protein
MSEDRYRTLFDLAADCLMILDLDGTIRDINRTGYERLGYTRDEMVGMHITELDPPEFAAEVPSGSRRSKKAVRSSNLLTGARMARSCRSRSIPG